MIDENLFESLKDYNHRRKYNIDFKKDKKYESILCSRYNKIGRIKRRLIYLFNNKKYLWFITFTFNNSYIDKCERTKKDLIKNSLKGFDFLYILNIDYGSKTEREHYHCILGTDYDFNLDVHLKSRYPCFSFSEKIIFNDISFKRLSKYINKLTNHCLKESTKNSRIYFSFKLPESSIDSYSQWIIYKKKLALLDKANVTGKN